MEKLKPQEESMSIKKELRVNMNAFLSKSTLCFPPFIACVQVQPSANILTVLSSLKNLNIVCQTVTLSMSNIFIFTKVVYIL